MSQPVLDLSIATRTVIRMRQLPSLSTMEPMLVTGIVTEIERDVAARGNGNETGIGMIKMIKMMTESHEREERARVMMAGKGRRSEDDIHLLCIITLSRPSNFDRWEAPTVPSRQSITSVHVMVHI
jgi:hypothetical protein